MPRSLKRLTLVMLGSALALLAAELLLHLFHPGLVGAEVFPVHAGDRAQFEVDEKVGFLPKLGKDTRYGEYGCRANEYDPKDRKGRERILFVGDSVTGRGHIVNGLRQLYGDDNFEY